MNDVVIYLGGRFVEPEQALVPVLDRGYLLGDGVFATMRGYDGVCFRSDAHLAEIENGANMLGIDLPKSVADMADLADEAARRTKATDAYVRVTLTHGTANGTPNLSIVARPMDVPSDADYGKGVDAIIVKPRRIPPSCMDGTIKTTSYAAQVVARREVQLRGAGEGIQLAVDGSLACGTMSTLFVVMKNTLLTPSLESGCRAGVTRAAILEIAPRLRLEVRETRIEPSALDEADEVFFASTRVECLPVTTIEGRRIGRGDFPRVHAFRAALVALIQEETDARRRASLRVRAAARQT